MIIAKWQTGTERFYKGADPNKVANEIIEIGDSATTKEVLEKARNVDTELHKCFEWDDSVAAERYRLSQARTILCNLVIERKDDPEAPEIRRFYRADTTKSAYVPIEHIVRNEDQYAKLLKMALAELHSFRNKYSTLSELREIFDLIDEL